MSLLAYFFCFLLAASLFMSLHSSVTLPVLNTFWNSTLIFVLYFAFVFKHKILGWQFFAFSLLVLQRSCFIVFWVIFSCFLVWVLSFLIECWTVCVEQESDINIIYDLWQETGLFLLLSDQESGQSSQQLSWICFWLLLSLPGSPTAFPCLQLWNVATCGQYGTGITRALCCCCCCFCLLRFPDSPSALSKPWIPCNMEEVCLLALVPSPKVDWSCFWVSWISELGTRYYFSALLLPRVGLSQCSWYSLHGSWIFPCLCKGKVVWGGNRFPATLLSPTLCFVPISQWQLIPTLNLHCLVSLSVFSCPVPNLSHEHPVEEIGKEWVQIPPNPVVSEAPNSHTAFNQ